MFNSCWGITKTLLFQNLGGKIYEFRKQWKEKALESALGQIEKQFGKGSVMKLGDFTAMNVESIPTGALSLDVALGIGGIQREG